MEKEMATHPSIPCWEIPWTGEPGRLLSMQLQRVGHNLATKQRMGNTQMRTRKKWRVVIGKHEKQQRRTKRGALWASRLVGRIAKFQDYCLNPEDTALSSQEGPTLLILKDKFIDLYWIDQFRT